MNINKILKLDIVLDSGEELANTEFTSLSVIEACYAMPMVTLSLVFMSKLRFEALRSTKLLDITITYGETLPPRKFKVQVLSVKSPMVGITKIVQIKGLLFIKEFNLDRQKRTFLEKTPTEVVNAISSIPVKVGDFTVPDTFFQLNTNDWDFLCNQVIPFTKSDKEGIPFMGVTMLPELRFYDYKDEREADYKISPNGIAGTYEYSALRTDTGFSEEYFLFNRLHSVVNSIYKEPKYLPLSEENPIIDRPMVFDNGNCAEDHAIMPILNTYRFTVLNSIKVDFDNNTYTPFELLDKIDLMTSENELAGKLWVTKVETTISTGFKRTIHLKGM